MSGGSAGESVAPADAEPGARSRAGDPKVIYVMGAGHSGSTILGVALGNCERIFYAGELEEWTLRGGVPKFGGSERTRFWRAVSENLADASDLFGAHARECLERSSAVLRADRWRDRWRLRRRYRQVAGELFGAIAGVADVTHVVDTSHFPLRAKELQRVNGIELYLVFLVRDPQSVIESYVGHINRHALLQRRVRIVSKNLDLWLTYLLSVLVFLRHPRERRLLLRHEDFIADPEGVLRDLLRQVNSSAELPDLSALSTGMPLQGNRLLWSDVVALNSKPIAPVRGSRLTALLQLPFRAILLWLKPAAAAKRSPEHVSAHASR
jgi:Sulfotransferase family